MTEEQQAVIDAVCSSEHTNKIISVNAVAGAGKTTTALAITKAVKPKVGFYTAFNRAIVKDSAKKFDGIIDAKTIHSLAYHYVNPSKTPEELSYTTVTEKISYTEKRQVIDGLDSFYRSQHTTLEDYFEDTAYSPLVENLIVQYADKMYKGKIPVTFNYLLKCFHLLLQEGKVNPKFDLFIFDEFQDVVPVSLEIFKLISSKKKVILGDTHQNIYKFLNTVNGFELLDNTYNLQLTKSFRCSEEVAKSVQEFGTKAFGPSFKFTGNANVEPIGVPPSTVFLSKSNSDIIVRMHELVQQDLNFSLVRSLDEIFELPFAIISVAANKPIYSKQYKFLECEKREWKSSGSKLSYIRYLATLGIEEVTSAVNTIVNLNSKGINIFDLKKKLKQTKSNKDIVLSTAHAFKGLEKDIAVIESNLDTFKMSTKRDVEQRIQDNNLYYVALSRAKHNIVRM